MTDKEIKNLIKQSNQSEFLTSLNIEIKYYKDSETFNFSGFYELWSFVRTQRDEWNKIENKLPEEFKKSKYYFNQFYDKMEKFLTLENLKDDWDWYITGPFIINDNGYSMTNKIITYNPSITPLLISCYKNSQKTFEGCRDYLYNSIDNFKFAYKEYFAGLQRGYQFEGPEKELERIIHNESTFDKLKNKFQEFISNSEKEYAEQKDFQQKEFKSKEKDFQDCFNKTSDDENIRQENRDKSFNDLDKESRAKVEQLEKLYANKLMLSKPATYWDDRAKKLKEESKKWLIGLILSVIIALCILVTILIKISDKTLIDLFSNIGSSIKWSIVFITIISFLAFTMKILSKLTMSSYHLARDAEERKQLVYVYLSLLNENAISEQERVIILQSLFSRSDTGLLKEDSSPTMPSINILEKVMSK